MANCTTDLCGDDPIYTTPLTPAPLPTDDCECGGGGGGEGHKYTFVKTATGWQVKEDGRVIFTYNDVDTNTTYTWQATTDGWLVKDNTGKVLFTYKDKDTDTTYSFEKKDDCGFKVTNSKGEVVFDYDNDCAGTTYTFEQDGVDIKVTDNKTGKLVFTYKGTKDTNTTYTFEDYKKGFKVTDSDGVVAYIYDPDFDPSDGSYPIDTLLTTVIKGHTTIATGQIVGFTPANLVVGETLVYDGVGTVGVITKDNGDGTYEVTTMTISPGSRQGVRLGSVKKEEDLPATCAAAEALGWQTPQLGDFAYVIEGEGTSEDVISEYVITNIDDDCNITWTFSHSFNAGQYQEQSKLSMAGMILTGGAIPGTFGDPIDPSTLIRGVMRNGVLLTPDAQGKVNVIVDDSHVIVNELPTTGIVDHIEYLVIDPTTLKVKSTWVHDPTGWYQTYEAQVVVKSHQIVTALPTTNIEENVEYIIVDDSGKLSETWVYDPTLGWVQTEVLDKPAHIVVKDLPTTGIDDETEYVQVEDLNDPVNTYVASWVHTDKGWVKVAENVTAQKAHIAVTALPTTNINENAEYLVMTNTSDPATLTGTWVRVNGNWVQTERMEEGFHIVTSLPTSNIDDKNEYIVVSDLTKPDETLIGHYAYDKATNKWVDLTNKYIVEHGVTMNGYATSADDFQDMPVGGVVPFFGKEAPAHYLICDGATYNLGTYPELEAFFIEEYGKVNQFGGNGTTTWAVPDLRGEFLRGAGANSHTNTALGIKEGSGSSVGTHQEATSFGGDWYGDSHIEIYSANSNYGGGQGSPREKNTDAGINSKSRMRVNGTISAYGTDGDGSFTSRPTNTSVNWVIKAESTYAIIPNSDYKTMIKFNGVTAVPGNTTVGTVVNANVTTKFDDTSLWNAGGYFVAPVDGYYNMSVYACNTTSLPATNQARLSAWLVKQLPATSAWSEMRESAYAMNLSGDMVSQPSVIAVSTSGEVRLNKGDKVYIVLTNGWQTNTIGHATFSLAAPVSNTQINTAEAMMKPNTWPVGVEQNFGDGVFGMRVKGTINLKANTVSTFVVLPVGSPYVHVFNCGGEWEYTKNQYMNMGSALGGTSYSSGLDNMTGQGRACQIGVYGPNNLNGARYDVWILYTKD